MQSSGIEKVNTKSFLKIGWFLWVSRFASLVTGPSKDVNKLISWKFDNEKSISVVPATHAASPYAKHRLNMESQ